MSVLLSVVCCVLIAPANPVTAFPRPATSIGSRDYVTGAPVAAKIAYEYVNCPLQHCQQRGAGLGNSWDDDHVLANHEGSEVHQGKINIARQVAMHMLRFSANARDVHMLRTLSRRALGDAVNAHDRGVEVATVASLGEVAQLRRVAGESGHQRERMVV